MRIMLGWLNVILLAVLPGTAAAQTPIRVDVSLVNVAFAARDSQGKLVENLTRNDIELNEDGVPQKIEFFARSTDLPLTLGLIVDVSSSQDQFGKKHKKDLEVLVLYLKRPEVKDRPLGRWVGALQIQRLGGSRRAVRDLSMGFVCRRGGTECR